MVTRLSSGNASDEASGLDVRPLSGYIGAEILGVDLAASTPELITAIRAVLLRWKVVFFRDQDITPAQHIEFGRQFGALVPGYPTKGPVSPEYPELIEIGHYPPNDWRSPVGVYEPPSGPSEVEYINLWHSDASFLVNPPMASILRAVVVPPYGGDTPFINMAIAYERLSPSIRNLIDGLHAVHHNVRPIARGEIVEENSDRDAGFQGNYRTVHPVVRVHPETGERALFVNPQCTSHIVELSRQEGRHLLALLYEHMTATEFMCLFRWQPGSIAFWDNRVVCHNVPRNVPGGFERTMQRITLVGDAPVGVDGRPSYALSGEAFG